VSSTTPSLRALLVDDEAPARRTLQLLLASHRDVQVVGECASGPEAVAAIESSRPDLLFLDIHLPGFNGFEVLQRVQDAVPPSVVFVTAYDEHAIRAFDEQAVDYLLKPFDDERFHRALERAKAKVRHRQLEGLARQMAAVQASAKDEPTPSASGRHREPEFLERVAVREAGRIFFVRASDIDWIEAQDYYVQLHVADQTHLLRESMRNLEARLDPRRFVRIHRSTLVNLDRVSELRPFFHGEYTVILNDGTQLKLSRSYRDRLELLLGNR